MTGIIELIVVAIASLFGGIFIVLRRKASSGKTSQATRDLLDGLGEKIAEKRKEAEEAIKNHDEQFDKNTDYINSPVDSIDDTVDTANELWNRRNRS